MDDKLGTLEPGKLADVLVVEGNPLEGFDALLNVAHVFRDGYWVVRDGWPGSGGLRAGTARRSPVGIVAGWLAMRKTSQWFRVPSGILASSAGKEVHALVSCLCQRGERLARPASYD